MIRLDKNRQTDNNRCSVYEYTNWKSGERIIFSIYQIWWLTLMALTANEQSEEMRKKDGRTRRNVARSKEQ